jgi:hypothetical protein
LQQSQHFLGNYLGESKPLVIPDLDLISGAYGRINQYLHTPKRVFETWGNKEWWRTLKETLDRVISHLEHIHSGPMAYMDLNPVGEDLFAKYASGDITSEDLVREFDKTFAQQKPQPPAMSFLEPRKK